MLPINNHDVTVGLKQNLVTKLKKTLIFFIRHAHVTVPITITISTGRIV